MTDPTLEVLAPDLWVARRPLPLVVGDHVPTRTLILTDLAFGRL